LADSLIIAKDKRLIFPDWSSAVNSKLIPPEGWDLPIEEVSRIERAVAEKLVSSPVELIGCGARNGIHHPT
jgi:hypothetical protein